MKSILIGLMSLMLLNVNAQNMNTPQEIITNLFIATDQQHWEEVEEVFNTEVLLDYSSMNGNKASQLNPEQIITSWQTILPGFERTHHQLGNFICRIKEDKATVFCYGIASHYLPDENGNIWTVVGSYDFELVKTNNGNWKIASMKFNFKYQDGNTSLPEKAMQNIK